jgi:hypothetical protein
MRLDGLMHEGRSDGPSTKTLDSSTRRGTTREWGRISQGSVRILHFRYRHAAWHSPFSAAMTSKDFHSVESFDVAVPISAAVVTKTASTLEQSSTPPAIVGAIGGPPGRPPMGVGRGPVDRAALGKPSISSRNRLSQRGPSRELKPALDRRGPNEMHTRGRYRRQVRLPTSWGSYFNPSQGRADLGARHPRAPRPNKKAQASRGL